MRVHIALVELRVALHEEANDAYVAKARRREKSRALVGATAHVDRSAGAEKCRRNLYMSEVARDAQGRLSVPGLRVETRSSVDQDVENVDVVVRGRTVKGSLAGEVNIAMKQPSVR